MKRTLTRVLAALATAAGTLVVTAVPHAAAGNPLGSATLNPTSGDQDTELAITPPAGASCTGSGASGYRWSTFLVDAGVDASTLHFTSAGPVAVPGHFVAPLYAFSDGTTVANRQPSGTPTGLISNIPTVKLGWVLPPDATFVDGDYKIGFACTQAGVIENGKFWQSSIAISGASGTSTSTFAWQLETTPAAPTLNSPLTVGDGSLSGSFSAVTAMPAVTTYTITAAPQPSGTPVTKAVAAAGAFTVTGLTNGTAYSVTVTATNAVGTGPASNAVSGTPVSPTPPSVTFPAPTLNATPKLRSVDVSWTAPAGDSDRTGYTIAVTPSVSGAPFTVGASATSYTVNGLTLGTEYSFSITATYPAPNTGTTSAVVKATPLPPLFTAVTPKRIFDTRPGEAQGAVTVTQQRYGGAGNILKVKVTGAAGVPEVGVGAVSLNVTAIDPDGPGFVTVYPCGDRPLAANLNYVKGDIVPNAVIAPVSPNGEVCFYSLANTHLVADVSGWFAKGAGFNSVTPKRVFETRPGEAQGAVTVTQQRYGGAGNILKVKVTGAAGVPETGVGAVSLNVTAIQPDGPGFVTVYPCGERPLAANLNYVKDQIVPNAVIAPVSDSGEVCFYSLANSYIVADVSGWFAKGSGFNALTPKRVFETRPGEAQGAVTVTQQRYGGAGNILKVKVTGAAGVPETGVGAVSLNVTAIQPDGPGFITVYPCGDRPLAANLNYVKDQIVPNAVIAPVSDSGEVCFYSLANSYIVADVAGWFSA